jgi:hypothetical protein
MTGNRNPQTIPTTTPTPSLHDLLNRARYNVRRVPAQQSETAYTSQLRTQPNVTRREHLHAILTEVLAVFEEEDESLDVEVSDFSMESSTALAGGAAQ